MCTAQCISFFQILTQIIIQPCFCTCNIIVKNQDSGKSYYSYVSVTNFNWKRIKLSQCRRIYFSNLKLIPYVSKLCHCITNRTEQKLIDNYLQSKGRFLYTKLWTYPKRLKSKNRTYQHYISSSMLNFKLNISTSGL